MDGGAQTGLAGATMAPSTHRAAIPVSDADPLVRVDDDMPHIEVSRTAPKATVVISGTASDSHTWNLVYLQLLIQELGHAVVNLGSCVPDGLLVAECRQRQPDLVVISSVNGHGFNDGLRLAALLSSQPELADTALVIGGKLGTDGLRSVGWQRRLLDAGFDRVFDGGDLAAFLTYLDRFAERLAS